MKAIQNTDHKYMFKFYKCFLTYSTLFLGNLSETEGNIEYIGILAGFLQVLKQKKWLL